MTKITKFSVNYIHFPTSKDLGYSIELKENSVNEFSYPKWSILEIN